MNRLKLNIAHPKDFQSPAPLAAPSPPSMNVRAAFWVNNTPWVLLALESQESVQERERALTSVGLVQQPLTRILCSKRGTTFCLFFPLAPIFHSAVSMITNIFFHYWLTCPLKWYLFHLLVLSFPVCPFQRLNSETVAKQLYIIAASHQLLIVLSTFALQIWTACDNGK